MMRKKEEKLVITFHTTAEAIAIERYSKVGKIKGRMIPVPRELSTGCGIAWCCELEYEQEMKLFMENNDIEYDVMVRMLY